MNRIISILVLVSFLAACTNNNQNNNVGYNNNTDSNKPNTITVKDSNIQHVERKTGEEISQHLVNLASGVPSVKDATAVVVGKYAIVGIDVDSNIDRSEVGTIKYSVAEALKNDPYGAQALVVADPDINARLDEIGSDIQSGQPLQGIMNELSDITGRIIPETPKSLQNTDSENAPEEPKKKMNNEKEKQLNKEQNDQSHHRMD
jgi:YhcN/YlaJ family sporulation lipoprotein